MTRRTLAGLATASVLALGVVAPAGATVGFMEKAKKAGFPARDCGYCHTFDTRHMQEEARKAGVTTTNCYDCHGRVLPKTGDDLYNARGRWLRSEAQRRRQKPLASWLADYPGGRGEEPSSAPSPASR